MTERPMPDPRTLDDTGLEAALRGLAPAIAWPAATATDGPDLAVRVRVRLQERAALPPTTRRWPWSRPSGPAARRLPRAAVLALLALLALAAIAGAVGLGLPGLRLVLGEPPASAVPSPAPGTASPAVPSQSPGAPGSRLGLGRAVTLEEARALTGRPLPLPTDPSLGPPDAVYVDATRNDQVALVWAADPDLPASLEPGIGLILMSFDGRVHPDFATKLIGSGTTLERVRVGDDPGFWISGEPHFFFYETSEGGFVEDSRRWVGDALVWSDGVTTYRLESGLGRDASIALAATVP